MREFKSMRAASMRNTPLICYLISPYPFLFAQPAIPGTRFSTFQVHAPDAAGENFETI